MPPLRALLPLAGCLAPAANVEPFAEEVFLPYHAEGVSWVKPSDGMRPQREEVPFLVNATGRDVTAALAMRERYFGLELPRSTGGHGARLVDANGKVLASARRPPIPSRRSISRRRTSSRARARSSS